MSAFALENIEQLSVAERIQLIEDIWDSIAASPEGPELTGAQQQELDHRLQAHDQNPVGAPWTEVRARLQS